MSLTREQWMIVREVIAEPPRREDGRGRPWRDSRSVLDGILWVIRRSSPWKAMPEGLPPYQTCHRRFRQWVEDGTFSRIVVALIVDLERRGGTSLRWMLSSRPETALYAEALAEYRPDARRGRPDWRCITIETLLSPRMARVLAEECDWPLVDAATEYSAAQ